MLARPVCELTTLSLVRGEPETVRAFFAEKDSVSALFECSRLVTAGKLLETAAHRASLAGRCHWHMVKRKDSVALSAASYLLSHWHTLPFDSRSRHATKMHFSQAQFHPLCRNRARNVRSPLPDRITRV